MNIKQESFYSDKCNSSVQILHPQPEQIAGLRNLWKEAFSDDDAFLNTFFSTAFAPERCLCIVVEKNVVAALYWFQCEYSKQPLAYIYAVATAKAYRGRGLCRKLLAAAHSTLTKQGYIGALLVPGSETLFDLYKKCGYQTTCYRQKLHFEQSRNTFPASVANQTSVAIQSLNKRPSSTEEISPIKEISATEYATLRQNYLPPNSVLQEKENLSFLQTQLSFYSSKNFLAAITITDNELYCPEFLYTDYTNSSVISEKKVLPDNFRQDLMHQLLSYFDCISGTFCTPKGNTPFAMYYPLNDSFTEVPKYFAFAFD